MIFDLFFMLIFLIEIALFAFFIYALAVKFKEREIEKKDDKYEHIEK